MIQAYVTDTHPLVFHAHGGKRLGPRARRIFDAAERERAIIYVPAIVLWELSLLLYVGRVELAQGSVQGFSEELFSNPAFQPHALTHEQAAIAEGQRPNDDPFDALICAAATTLGLPLITRDARITDADFVRTVW